MSRKQLQQYAWAKPTINFYSVKNQCSMWCESYLERDSLLRLEFQPEVSAYTTQPISFVYKDWAGDDRRYTPDQLVRIDEKYKFGEVKRDVVANSASFREAFSHLQMHSIGRYQAPLELVVESDIRHGEYINNLKKLYGYKAVSLSHLGSLKLKQIFGSDCIFAELIDFANSKKLSPVIPFALLAQDRFRCDLSLALNEQTVLEIAC